MSKSARKPQKQAKKATQEEAENEVPLLDVSLNGEEAEPPAEKKKGKRKADVLDPTQDPVVRRKIRQSYRALLEKPPEELQRVEDATALVNEANKIFTEVRMPREAVLDAEVLKRAAERGVESAQNVQANFRPRDPGQLLRKLRTFGRPQPSNAAAAENGHPEHEQDGEQERDEDDAGAAAETNWDAIAAAAVKHFAVAPVPVFFFGALEPPEKVKKTRQAANKREGKAALVRPEELKGADLAKADPQARETSRRVQSLLQRLEQVKRKNLYELLVNPQSFSQTMENFFHFSFLIKDGHASIEVVDGVPFAQMRDQPDEKDEDVITTQCVFTLDHRMWKATISQFSIKSAFLGHRQPSEQALELQKIAHTEVDVAAAAAAAAARAEEQEDDEGADGAGEDNERDASPPRSSQQKPKKRTVQLQLTPTRAPKAKQPQMPRVSLKAAAAPVARSKARARVVDDDKDEDEPEEEESPQQQQNKKQQNGTKRSRRTIQTSDDEEAPAASKRRSTAKTQEDSMQENAPSQLVDDSQQPADATPAPVTAASQSSSQGRQASQDAAAAADSQPSASQHTLSDAGSSQLRATPSAATPAIASTASQNASGRKRRAKVLASDSE